MWLSQAPFIMLISTVVACGRRAVLQSWRHYRVYALVISGLVLLKNNRDVHVFGIGVSQKYPSLHAYNMNWVSQTSLTQFALSISESSIHSADYQCPLSPVHQTLIDK